MNNAKLNKMFDSEMMNKFKDLLKHNDHKIVELEKQIFLLSKELENIQLELTNSNKNKLEGIFKNKITVLTGQSGAGKSSLLNLLDPSLKLRTNEISKALNRGKHTTRHSQIYIKDDILFS